MPSLKEIRNRVKSVTNTRKITRAMKLVAAAKLRRAQDAVTASRPYASKMREVVQALAETTTPDDHALLRKAETPRKLLIVPVTSDRGLCGGFNTSLIRKTEEIVRTQRGAFEEIGVTPIGRKGRDYFGRRDVASYADLKSRVTDSSSASAVRGAEELIRVFLETEVDEVWVVYNEFVSALTQEVVVEPLLPVQPAEIEQPEDAPDGSTEYIYEHAPEELLDHVLPRYVESQLYIALVESFASEMGARMTAMDNATNNAGDLIDTLTLQMNRARQAAITTELVEITTGAQALEG